jgi:hypothetical protein
MTLHTHHTRHGRSWRGQGNGEGHGRGPSRLGVAGTTARILTVTDGLRWEPYTRHGHDHAGKFPANKRLEGSCRSWTGRVSYGYEQPSRSPAEKFTE